MTLRSIVPPSVLILMLAASTVVADDQAVVHQLNSARQSAATTVRVLQPNVRQPGQLFPVLYVLPVEAGEGTRWGDSIGEVLKHDLHNRHSVICVFPTFSDLPWYANHPTDARLRQESYLLDGVIPFVESLYPVRKEAAGRLLAGFSKSGWGAWTLILRHPDVFGRAAAFDAPMMLSATGKYGSGPIFGDDENFRSYQVTRLLPSATKLRTARPRLSLFGRGNFEQEHRQVLELAGRERIPIFVEDSPQRAHSWHSGWLPNAVAWLTASADATNQD